MDPFTISLLLGAGGAVVNSATSLINQSSSNANALKSLQLQQEYNKQNMASQYAYNEQAAQSAYDRAMQAWNLQNEYNSPAAQMARYQEAGLNPNLVYGQGTSGNAGSVQVPSQAGVSQPSVSAPRLRGTELPGLGNPLALYNAMTDLQIKRAQLRQVEATTQNIDQRTTNARLESANILQRLDNLQVQAASGRLSLDVAKAQVQKIIADTQYTNQRAQFNDVLFPYQAAAAEGKVEQTALQNEEIRSKITQIIVNTALSQAGVDLLPLKRQALEASIRKTLLSGDFQELENELYTTSRYSGIGSAWITPILNFVRTLIH